MNLELQSNPQISSPNLSDLETIVASLLAEGKCACHIINPHKTRILMWKKVENGITIYHLRIGIQKFVAQELTDRNGETYWRYWNLEKVEDNQTLTNPIIKFNQRQEPAKDYAKPTDHTDPSVNS